MKHNAFGRKGGTVSIDWIQLFPQGLPGWLSYNCPDKKEELKS